MIDFIILVMLWNSWYFQDMSDIDFYNLYYIPINHDSQFIEINCEWAEKNNYNEVRFGYLGTGHHGSFNLKKACEEERGEA